MSVSLPTDYIPLMRELVARAAKIGQPVNGAIELTERCNMRCRMCYVCQPAGDQEQRTRELSAAQWVEIARQAKANGTLFLLLTGGEVFLRPDFFEIYTPLTRMGFLIAVYTNGTLVTDEIAAQLAAAPPSRTEITLYGGTQQAYEAVTGVPGSYARCISGIEALLRHKVPLVLKSTLTRQNVAELDLMERMAHDWGVPFSAGWLITARRDGEHSDAANCRLSAIECVELEANDRASSTEWYETAMRESTSRDERNFYCHAGVSSYVINARGEMGACMDLPLPAARPLEVGFSQAWAQTQAFVASAPPLDQECLDCDLRSYCGRCPAWSYLETGTLTKPVPYLGEIARARKERYEPHA